jgi:hypothetical protein
VRLVAKVLYRAVVTRWGDDTALAAAAILYAVELPWPLRGKEPSPVTS